MVNVLQFRVIWGGFSGAPGYTSFHVREDLSDAQQLQSWADNLGTFFGVVEAFVPSAVTFNIDGNVNSLDVPTGQLVAQHSITPWAQKQGAITGPYSASSGMVIDWRTGQYRNGRQVRGRSFIVPIGGSKYDSSGTLDETMRSTVQTAAVNMVDAEPQPLSIYSRPQVEPALEGALNAVSSVSIPDIAAVLRSRRD